MWIKGDLHVHSNACYDASLSVSEIIKRSKGMIDFLAISGHARNEDKQAEEQYKQVMEARKQYPDIPVFHCGEMEFPIERHCIFLSEPDNRECLLRSEIVRLFDRRKGHTGIEKAKACLKYVEDNWQDKALMIFNHPDTPPVSFDNLLEISKSPVFKVLACYDRGFRVAPQCWEVGAEWDKLLCAGQRIFTRFGSDFHRHFEDGGSDFYPGEFVQDQLTVKSNTYEEILNAYMTGNFFCSTDNLISELTQSITPDALEVSFKCNLPVYYFEIISDGKIIDSINEIPKIFHLKIPVIKGTYYRLRGFGFERKCPYSKQVYRPVFMSNPIFTENLCE